MKSKCTRSLVFFLVLSFCFLTLCVNYSYASTTEGLVPTTCPVDIEEINIEQDNGNQRSLTTVRYLALRVLLGTTYRNDYSDPVSEATTRISYVEIPFVSTWSFGFNPTFAYVSPLPIDSCTLASTVPCSDAVCGSNCTNSISTLIHHKNANKNLAYVKYYFPLSSYDLMLTLVSSKMCGIWNNVDYPGNVLGVAYVNGDYALASNSSTTSEVVRVRIIQHEISHLFGCEDGACTEGYRCIMSGGFDDMPLSVLNIWCPACTADFNSNAH